MHSYKHNSVYVCVNTERLCMCKYLSRFSTHTSIYMVCIYWHVHIGVACVHTCTYVCTNSSKYMNTNPLTIFHTHLYVNTHMVRFKEPHIYVYMEIKGMIHVFE